jgi:hypothetical protein
MAAVQFVEWLSIDFTSQGLRLSRVQVDLKFLMVELELEQLSLQIFFLSD